MTTSIRDLYNNHSYEQRLHRQLLHIRHTHSRALVREVIAMLREHSMTHASLVTINDFMLTVTQGYCCNSFVIKSLRGGGR